MGRNEYGDRTGERQETSFIGDGCPTVPGEQRKQKILRERARVLAREPVQDEAPEDTLQVLEFLLSRERYAIETRFIGEVFPMKSFTVLPCTPRFLVGAINVRGEVLPLVDIREFLNLPEKVATGSDKVVIVKTDTAAIGVVADEIVEVRNIPYRDLQSPGSLSPGIGAEYLKVMTDDRLVVLEIEKLLAERRLTVHEEVSQ